LPYRRTGGEARSAYGQRTARAGHAGEDKGTVGLGNAAEFLATGAQHNLRSGDHGPAAVFHLATQFPLRRAPCVQLRQDKDQCQDKRAPKVD
jgi:hypothetical protein